MRILLSTTIAHNPGDELIARGVLNLLRYGQKINDLEVVVYNRNPDLQYKMPRTPITNSIGNYYTDPVDLTGIDAVVLAGSPEWFGPPMEPLYKELYKNPKIPLYCFGVGLGDPSATLTELDRDVLVSATTIPRSTDTYQFLKGYEMNCEEPLPCPALFSSMGTFQNQPKGVLRVVQAPGHGWHEVRESFLKGLKPEHEKLCVHVKELAYYRDAQYAGSCGAVLDKIARYSGVISTRLHAAIAALSLEIPAAVVGKGDFRIETCADMFGDLLPCVENFTEAEKALDLTIGEKIKEFKWESWNAWNRALGEIL